jgi:hypothetical protein
MTPNAGHQGRAETMPANHEGYSAPPCLAMLGALKMSGAQATNRSMAVAISSGTSSMGKWLSASSFDTWNQGCAAPNDRWAARYPESSGWAYMCNTGTAGSKAASAWRGCGTRHTQRLFHDQHAPTCRSRMSRYPGARRLSTLECPIHVATLRIVVRVSAATMQGLGASIE